MGIDSRGVLWYYIQVAETDKACENAGVAQLVEQLICNQQVGGSSPSTSSTFSGQFHMGGFPSGQREQTVNLSSMTSVVRIHHLPPVWKALNFECFSSFISRKSFKYAQILIFGKVAASRRKRGKIGAKWVKFGSWILRRNKTVCWPRDADRPRLCGYRVR